ncbi:hypothetical protein HMPREF9418_1677 [Neisseria macacae ATCC 33926]|uniref:Uncharacterized protein n=1 Tax=Neisseria macacae ATCC 33926 TaxID=997348 RepID=A0AA36XKA5_9NEIS|nr:hypothetical protein HMPREF9418_1677 [Neisseria macacae ATCC 33926]
MNLTALSFSDDPGRLKAPFQSLFPNSTPNSSHNQTRRINKWN